MWRNIHSNELCGVSNVNATFFLEIRWVMILRGVVVAGKQICFAVIAVRNDVHLIPLYKYHTHIYRNELRLIIVKYVRFRRITTKQA